MQARLIRPNTLSEQVQSDPNLTRGYKTEWKNLESSDIGFPILALKYLETLACGTFQFNQAPEHLTTDEDYQIWVYQHSDDLIRGQIQSRHKSQTKYNVWIQFDASDRTDPIKYYYCVLCCRPTNCWHANTYCQYSILPRVSG